MNSLNRLKSKIAVSVSAVFLYSTIAAPLAEANFWQERKKAVAQTQTSNSAHSPVNQYAQVPAGLTDLNNALPRVTNGLPGLQRIESIDQGASGNASSPDARRLPKWLSSLPSSYGEIQKIRLVPQADKRPMVLLMQDAHGIYSAQLNIAHMLGHLQTAAEKEGQSNLLVALEGSAGAYDFAPYRKCDILEHRKLVSDFLLEKSLLSGPEVFGMMAKNLPTFWGVETPALYVENVEAFRASVPEANNFKKAIDNLEASLKPVKNRFYNLELWALDENLASYHKGELDLLHYVRFLSGHAVNMSHFPEVKRLLEVLKLEESLDFKAVEAERSQLIQVLSQKLDQKSLNDLLQYSLAYRAGQVSYGRYYEFLRSLSESRGVHLNKFSAFNGYIQYVLKAEAIEKYRLFDEVTSLKDAVIAQIGKTPEQKELLRISEDIKLLTRLQNFEFGPAEWTNYQSRRGEVMNLNARISAFGVTATEGSDPKAFAPLFERFYIAADKRNGAMVDNLLAKATETKSNAMVLVAGGFHTPVLESLLKSKDISVVTLTPKVGPIDKNTRYLDVFAMKHIPLEQMLLGEKLHLRKTDPTAVNQIVVAGAAAKDVAKFATVLEESQHNGGSPVRFGQAFVTSVNNATNNATFNIENRALGLWERFTSRIQQFRLNGQGALYLSPSTKYFWLVFTMESIVYSVAAVLLPAMITAYFSVDSALQIFLSGFLGGASVSLFQSYLVVAGVVGIVLAVVYGALHYFVKDDAGRHLRNIKYTIRAAVGLQIATFVITALYAYLVPELAIIPNTYWAIYYMISGGVSFLPFLLQIGMVFVIVHLLLHAVYDLIVLGDPSKWLNMASKSSSPLRTLVHDMVESFKADKTDKGPFGFGPALLDPAKNFTAKGVDPKHVLILKAVLVLKFMLPLEPDARANSLTEDYINPITTSHPGLITIIRDLNDQIQSGSADESLIKAAIRSLEKVDTKKLEGLVMAWGEIGKYQKENADFLSLIGNAYVDVMEKTAGKEKRASFLNGSERQEMVWFPMGESVLFGILFFAAYRSMADPFGILVFVFSVGSAFFGVLHGLNRKRDAGYAIVVHTASALFSTVFALGLFSLFGVNLNQHVYAGLVAVVVSIVHTGVHLLTQWAFGRDDRRYRASLFSGRTHDEILNSAKSKLGGDCPNIQALSRLIFDYIGQNGGKYHPLSLRKIKNAFRSELKKMGLDRFEIHAVVFEALSILIARNDIVRSRLGNYYDPTSTKKNPSVRNYRLSLFSGPKWYEMWVAPGWEGYFVGFLSSKLPILAIEFFTLNNLFGGTLFSRTYVSIWSLFGNPVYIASQNLEAFKSILSLFGNPNHVLTLYIFYLLVVLVWGTVVALVFGGLHALNPTRRGNVKHIVKQFLIGHAISFILLALNLLGAGLDSKAYSMFFPMGWYIWAIGDIFASAYNLPNIIWHYISQFKYGLNDPGKRLSVLGGAKWAGASQKAAALDSGLKKIQKMNFVTFDRIKKDLYQKFLYSEARETYPRSVDSVMGNLYPDLKRQNLTPLEAKMVLEHAAEELVKEGQLQKVKGRDQYYIPNLTGGFVAGPWAVWIVVGTVLETLLVVGATFYLPLQVMDYFNVPLLAVFWALMGAIGFAVAWAFGAAHRVSRRSDYVHATKNAALFHFIGSVLASFVLVPAFWDTGAVINTSLQGLMAAGPSPVWNAFLVYLVVHLVLHYFNQFYAVLIGDPSKLMLIGGGDNPIIMRGLAYSEGRLKTSPVKENFRPSLQADVPSIPDMDDESRKKYISLALNQLRDGQANKRGIFSTLAAGASSRMNTKEATPEAKDMIHQMHQDAEHEIKSKAAVPIGIFNGVVFTFLGLLMTNVARLHATVSQWAGRNTPAARVMILTNDDYRSELDAELAMRSNYGVGDDIIKLHQSLGEQYVATVADTQAYYEKKIKEEKEEAKQAILAKDRDLAIAAAERAHKVIAAGNRGAVVLADEKTPLGHGEFFHQIMSSGMFLELLDAPWVYVRNIDNSAAKYDEDWLVMLGMFLKDEMDFQPEVSPRAAKQKGGALVIGEDGRHILTEDPSFDATWKAFVSEMEGKEFAQMSPDETAAAANEQIKNGKIDLMSYRMDYEASSIDNQEGVAALGERLTAFKNTNGEIVFVARVTSESSAWFNNAAAFFRAKYLYYIYQRDADQTYEEFISEYKQAAKAGPEALEAIAHRGRVKFPTLIDPKPAKNTKAIAVKIETNMWQSTQVAKGAKIRAVGVHSFKNVDSNALPAMPESKRDFVLRSLRFLGTKQWAGPAESYQSNKPILDYLLQYILGGDLVRQEVMPPSSSPAEQGGDFKKPESLFGEIISADEALDKLKKGARVNVEKIFVVNAAGERKKVTFKEATPLLEANGVQVFEFYSPLDRGMHLTIIPSGVELKNNPIDLLPIDQLRQSFGMFAEKIQGELQGALNNNEGALPFTSAMMDYYLSGPASANLDGFSVDSWKSLPGGRAEVVVTLQAGLQTRQETWSFTLYPSNRDHGLPSQTPDYGQMVSLQVTQTVPWQNWTKAPNSGTSGAREPIDMSFDTKFVLIYAQTIADHYFAHGYKGPLLVGYDARLNNDRFAHRVAGLLAANGIEVIYVDEQTPTPVMAFLVNNYKAAGYVHLTPSHNPAQWMGLKFAPAHGGAAPDNIVKELNDSAKRVRSYAHGSFEEGIERGMIRRLIEDNGVNPIELYVDWLLNQFPQGKADIEKYAQEHPAWRVAVDAMYGTTAGAFLRLFGEKGLNILAPGGALRTSFNPSFGDVRPRDGKEGPRPEPDEHFLKPLKEFLGKTGNEGMFGVAGDNDGDRFGMINQGGKFVTPNQFASALLYFIALDPAQGGLGRKGYAFKTVPTTNLMNALAEAMDNVEGLFEGGVGFKNVVKYWIDKQNTPILVGAEESAHVGALGMDSWDDSIAMAFLAAWMQARMGKSVLDIVEEAEAFVGKHFEYNRDNVDLNDKMATSLRGDIDLAQKTLGKGVINDPEKFLTLDLMKQAEELGQFGLGKDVHLVSVVTVDGVKFVYSDGSWICFRASGTENVMRLYVEATSPINKKPGETGYEAERDAAYALAAQKKDVLSTMARVLRGLANKEDLSPADSNNAVTLVESSAASQKSDKAGQSLVESSLALAGLVGGVALVIYGITNGLLWVAGAGALLIAGVVGAIIYLFRGANRKKSGKTNSIEQAAEAKSVAEIPAGNPYKIIGVDGNSLRLGWVRYPEWSQIEDYLHNLPLLQGKKNVVFIGMGGSINTVKALNTLLGDAQQGVKVYTFDNLDPAAAAFIAGLDLSETLVVPISKSGNTPETRSLTNIFKQLFGDAWADHILFMSDPGKADKIAEAGYAGAAQVNIQVDRRDDVGGRFTAPHTGIFFVPLLILLGENGIEKIQKLYSAYRQQIEALLPQAVAQAAKMSAARTRNFAVVVGSPLLAKALNTWMAQLFQESLGKGDVHPKTIVVSDAADIPMGYGFEPVRFDLPSSAQNSPVLAMMFYAYLLQRFVAHFAELNQVNFVNQPEVERYKVAAKALKEKLLATPPSRDLEALTAEIAGSEKRFVDIVLFGDYSEADVESVRSRLQDALKDKLVHVYVGSDWNHHSYQAAVSDPDTLFVILTKASYALPLGVADKLSGQAEVITANAVTLKAIAQATHETLADSLFYSFEMIPSVEILSDHSGSKAFLEQVIALRGPTNAFAGTLANKLGLKVLTTNWDGSTTIKVIFREDKGSATIQVDLANGKILLIGEGINPDQLREAVEATILEMIPAPVVPGTAGKVFGFVEKYHTLFWAAFFIGGGAASLVLLYIGALPQAYTLVISVLGVTGIELSLGLVSILKKAFAREPLALEEWLSLGGLFFWGAFLAKYTNNVVLIIALLTIGTALVVVGLYKNWKAGEGQLDRSRLGVAGKTAPEKLNPRMVKVIQRYIAQPAGARLFAQELARAVNKDIKVDEAPRLSIEQVPAKGFGFSRQRNIRVAVKFTDGEVEFTVAPDGQIQFKEKVNSAMEAAVHYTLVRLARANAEQLQRAKEKAIKTLIWSWISSIVMGGVYQYLLPLLASSVYVSGAVLVVSILVFGWAVFTAVRLASLDIRPSADTRSFKLQRDWLDWLVPPVEEQLKGLGDTMIERTQAILDSTDDSAEDSLDAIRGVATAATVEAILLERATGNQSLPASFRGLAQAVFEFFGLSIKLDMVSQAGITIANVLSEGTVQSFDASDDLKALEVTLSIGNGLAEQVAKDPGALDIYMDHLKKMIDSSTQVVITITDSRDQALIKTALGAEGKDKVTYVTVALVNDPSDKLDKVPLFAAWDLAQALPKIQGLKLSAVMTGYGLPDLNLAGMEGRNLLIVYIALSQAFVIKTSAEIWKGIQSGIDVARTILAAA